MGSSWPFTRTMVEGIMDDYALIICCLLSVGMYGFMGLWVDDCT